MNYVLDNLARTHGTDKSSKVHDYCQFYERHLEARRFHLRSILELGVGLGSSLLMWRDYCPQARIYGIDLPGVVDRRAIRGVTLIAADIRNVKALGLVGKRVGPFDLVVDDASHITTEVLVACETLWPFVAPGGLYALEDTCCCYWSEYSRDVDWHNWLGKRVDDVHLHGARNHGIARRYDLVRGANALSPWEQTLAGIHIYNSLVILEKRDAE